MLSIIFYFTASMFVFRALIIYMQSWTYIGRCFALDVVVN